MNIESSSISKSIHLQRVLDDPSHNYSTAEREALLTDLVVLYQTAESSQIAQDIRRAFLLLLKEAPHLLNEETFATFLAQQIKPEDFQTMEWQTVKQMVTFLESLYTIQFYNREVADRIQAHLQHLLLHNLHLLEQRGEEEKIFQLMRLSPFYVMLADAELRRLRHRAYAYELHRVQRHRQFLYLYLVLQALFVLVIFPFLFINAENGRIQREVEQLTDVQLGDDGYQPLTYSEAVYWAIITASSIGYGDITPTTTTGRIIAAILGTIGVITVGIFAGLILDWLSPRRID